MRSVIAFAALVLSSALSCQNKQPSTAGDAVSSEPPAPAARVAKQDDGPAPAAQSEPQRAATEHAPDTPDDMEEHGHLPFAACPVEDAQSSGDEDLVDSARLLDLANRSFAQGDYAVAYDCASMAADVVPRSVGAHHLRAVSASALGHFDIAQMAFALALALDPDDPEILAAAADFYINAMPRKDGREPVLVGLEYARRGRTGAARRGVEKALRARLALLEAQALNDIGMAKEALLRAGEALRLRSRFIEAEHERGVALFNLCRFPSAKEAFAQVITYAPEDAYAHYHLGLIHERLGRPDRSEYHFQRARVLAPDDFWEPVSLSLDEFQREVERAIGELSSELQGMLADVSIEVAELPSLDDLTAVEPPFAPTILGLFRGLPLGADSAEYPYEIPERAIVLYHKNLARAARSRQELDMQVRRTLLHEIGHLSGLDENALRRRGLE